MTCITLYASLWADPTLPRSVFLHSRICQIFSYIVRFIYYRTFIPILPNLLAVMKRIYIIRSTFIKWESCHIYLNAEIILVSTFFSLNRKKPWKNNRTNSFLFITRWYKPWKLKFITRRSVFDICTLSRGCRWSNWSWAVAWTRLSD